MQGAGMALTNILKGLQAYKDIATYVVLPGKGVLDETLKELGVKVLLIPLFPSFWPPLNHSIRSYLTFVPRLFRTAFCNLLAFFRIKNIAVANNIDIIHSNTGVIRVGYFVSKSLGIKHIWHIREYQILDFGFSPFGGVDRLKSLYNRPNNTCIAITRGIFDFFSMDEKKDVVIYDGVDLCPSCKGSKENSDEYFLFVGSLLRGKGIFDLLEAFEQFSKSYSCKLLLAGKDEENIKEYITHLECGDKVELLGFISNVNYYMAHAKAIIIPSYFEGFGLICVEAMMNHCLVIGRNTAGIKEQFDNGLSITGHEIGVRFSNISELVTALTDVICSHEKFQETKEYAAIAVMQYSIDNNVSSIVKLYE